MPVYGSYTPVMNTGHRGPGQAYSAPVPHRHRRRRRRAPTPAPVPSRTRLPVRLRPSRPRRRPPRRDGHRRRRHPVSEPTWITGRPLRRHPRRPAGRGKRLRRRAGAFFRLRAARLRDQPQVGSGTGAASRGPLAAPGLPLKRALAYNLARRPGSRRRDRPKLGHGQRPDTIRPRRRVGGGSGLPAKGCSLMSFQSPLPPRHPVSWSDELNSDDAFLPTITSGASGCSASWARPSAASWGSTASPTTLSSRSSSPSTTSGTRIHEILRRVRPCRSASRSSSSTTARRTAPASPPASWQPSSPT